MKRIKAMNGYTIYQVTARDEKNGDGIEGEYAVFFSSDVRDYGVKYSTPEWDGIDSLQEAEWLCNDRENVTYAKARALCEAESTCFSYEDVEEKIEELKQRGIDATAYETADELEEAMTETMNTYKVSFETAGGIPCANIARAQNADDVERHYEAKGYIVYGVEQAYEIDVKIAERKGMPIVTIEHEENPDDIRYLIQATFTAQQDTPTHKAGETLTIVYGKEERSEEAPACAWFIEKYGYKRESDARRIMQRQYIDDHDDTEWWSISYELVRVSISETLEAGIKAQQEYQEQEQESDTQQASPDIPDITIEQRWSRDDVRRTCIEQNWYTCGDCTAYEKMLDMVEHTTPTTENIYRVAKDICDHSEYQTISNVMFGLMHDAVLTFYTIDGEEA